MKFTTEELSTFFNNISDKIKSGDSFEGTITYSCMEPGLEQGQWEVNGVFRVGNCEGQGGTVILKKTADA